MATKSNKSQMETFDPASWTPTELEAPDGRKWTASSLAEEKNLVAAHGYKPVSSGKGGQKAASTPTNEGTK